MRPPAAGRRGSRELIYFGRIRTGGILEGGDAVEGDGATHRIDRSDSGPAEAAKCTECGGSGAIVLLVSRKPCTACGGAGLVAESMKYYVIDPSTYPQEPPDDCKWSLNPQPLSS